MDSTTSVTIVIVTHNSEAVIAGALDSIPPGCEIVCIDNGSRDRTCEIVSRYPVQLIRNSNVGFGRAGNFGARVAETRYLLFLNPDARLCPDTVDELLKAAGRYPGSKIFSPRVECSAGVPRFRDTSRIDRWFGPSVARRPAEPVGDCCKGFVDGCVFFVERDFFLEAGGFDPNIFLYYEDDDFSYRLRLRKHPMIHVEAALAKHDVSTSSPATWRMMARRAYCRKISEYYVKAKYGKPTNARLDAVGALSRFVWYTMTLNRRRLLSAAGTLKALFALMAFPGRFPEPVTLGALRPLDQTAATMIAPEDIESRRRREAA